MSIDFEKQEMHGVSFNLWLKYTKKYDEYRNRAKNLKIDFTLRFEQFILAVTSNCYICGLDGKKHEIGIDRLNNKKGYTYYNIGGCCWNCNRMKADMSIPEFFSYLKRINPNHRLVNKEKSE